MRATMLFALLLLSTGAFAAPEQEGTDCTVKMNSSFRMKAPAGWRFAECSSDAQDDSRAFSLESMDDTLRAPESGGPPALTLYGGHFARGTVERVLANDREAHSTEFAPKDGEGLRTADKEDVRVLELTRRKPPFLWVTHGLVKAGPEVFWVVMECRQEDRCAVGYSVFKRLVGGLHVVRPNNFGGR